MRSVSKFLSVLAFLGGVAALHADTAAPAAKALSNDELLSGAAGIRSKIQDNYQHTLHIKEQAKKQKDVIKLTCVNDKLVQMKAQMNIGDQQNDSLQTALTAGSDDKQAIYGQLVQTGEAVKRLREDAAVCIGEPELYKQEAGISFTAPEIPDDPTNPPERGGDGPEPPGYASPYR